MSNAEARLLAISEIVCPRAFEGGWKSLSAAEKVFVCVWQLEAEVNNGGFEQFFFNSPGDQAEATVLALEAIGARHTAQVVVHANALFGSDGPPKDRDLRQEALESIEEDHEAELSSLNAAFLAYTDNLSDLLYKYVNEHGSEIQGPWIAPV